MKNIAKDSQILEMKSSMRKGNSHSFFLLFLTMLGILHQKQECNTAVRDRSTRKHQCLSSEGTTGDFSIGKHLSSFKALASVSRMPLAFTSKNMSLARISKPGALLAFLLELPKDVEHYLPVHSEESGTLYQTYIRIYVLAS